MIFIVLQLLSIKTKLYQECLYGFGKRRHGSFDLTGNDLLSIANKPPTQFFVGFLPSFSFQ